MEREENERKLQVRMVTFFFDVCLSHVPFELRCN